MNFEDGQGLESNMIGKHERKTCGEEVVDKSIQMGKGHKGTCVPCECSSKSDCSSGGI